MKRLEMLWIMAACLAAGYLAGHEMAMRSFEDFMSPGFCGRGYVHVICPEVPRSDLWGEAQVRFSYFDFSGVPSECSVFTGNINFSETDFAGEVKKP